MSASKECVLLIVGGRRGRQLTAVETEMDTRV